MEFRSGLEKKKIREEVDVITSTDADKINFNSFLPDVARQAFG